MKKTIGIMTLALATTMVTYAQSFKETFDANSLEWTECAYESNSGKCKENLKKMAEKEN